MEKNRGWENCIEFDGCLKMECRKRRAHRIHPRYKTSRKHIEQTLIDLKEKSRIKHHLSASQFSQKNQYNTNPRATYVNAVKQLYSMR